MSPKAKKAKVLEGFNIEVEFVNGEIKCFDMTPLLKYSVYESLKLRSYFEKIFVSQGIVQWPNEVDISPDLLYIDSRAVA